jgi:hypothetical protein
LLACEHPSGPGGSSAANSPTWRGRCSASCH